MSTINSIDGRHVVNAPQPPATNLKLKILIWASVLLSRSVQYLSQSQHGLLGILQNCSRRHVSVPPFFVSCPPDRLRLANTGFHVPILCFCFRTLPNSTTFPLPSLEISGVPFVTLSPVYNVQHVQYVRTKTRQSCTYCTNWLVYVIDTMAVEGPGELATSGRRV